MIGGCGAEDNCWSGLLSIMQPGVKDRSSHHGQWHDHWHSSASIREPVMYWVVKSRSLSQREQDLSETKISPSVARPRYPWAATQDVVARSQTPCALSSLVSTREVLEGHSAIPTRFFSASFFKYVYGFLWVYNGLYGFIAGLYGHIWSI